MHDGRRDDEVDHGGNKELEEAPEVDEALLPDHQGGDVPKGAEGAASIGGHHQIDEGQDHELGTVSPHRQNHRRHQQSRGQIIQHRGDEEGEDAGQPKELTIAQAAPDQPGAQGLEDVALVHDVDIGHGHQQEEEELPVFHDVVADSLLGLRG